MNFDSVFALADRLVVVMPFGGRVCRIGATPKQTLRQQAEPHLGFVSSLFIIVAVIKLPVSTGKRKCGVAQEHKGSLGTNGKRSRNAAPHAWVLATRPHFSSTFGN